jgi:hypothetical protein
MKKELIQSLAATFEPHAQQMTRIVCEWSGHPASDHFVDFNKMVPLGSDGSYRTTTRIAFSNMNRTVETVTPTPYTSPYIRPMAVRPLDHPERWPTPWGFLFSDSGFAKGRLQ